MKVKIRKLADYAVVPSYAKKGDAGMDLTATSVYTDEDGNIVYGTGLAFEIPEGYVGLLFPRSSIAKKPLLLSNSVGVIDSGYRGEVTFKFKPSCVLEPLMDCIGFTRSLKEEGYRVGERIGQIIILPYPSVEFVVTDELSATERGDGGYGSTGL